MDTASGMMTVLAGWREWVDLPDLGVSEVKAKLDTGARTSAIHAFNVKHRKTKRATYVAFEIHPVQDDDSVVVPCEARLVDRRSFTNPGGRTEQRDVIATTLRLGGQSWEIELALTNRDEMGFRMLIGRAAMKGRLLIDPGQSFLTSAPTPAAAEALMASTAYDVAGDDEEE